MSDQPSFSFRLQRGSETSGTQSAASPTMILELNESKKKTEPTSYYVSVQSRSKSAFGKESDNGITSANYDSSHGKVSQQDLTDLGINQALSKLETLPDGGHEVDAYGQGVQIYLLRHPSKEWYNGPAPGCSIVPSANASSAVTNEHKETFASIVKTLEKLVGKATMGSGAGSMGSKGTEPDTAYDD